MINITTRKTLSFRQFLKTALESVNQETIWDVMGWLMTRREELKKRAYLSQYLVKVSIPDEYMFDSDIQQCYEEVYISIQSIRQPTIRIT